MNLPESAVHWYEGMFLRPQHMQAFSRYLEFRISDVDRRAGPYHWGVIDLDVDCGSLKNHQFRILSADLICRGGTRVRIPDTAIVEARTFEKELELGRGKVDVFVGVPLHDPNRGALASPEHPNRPYVLDNDRGRIRVPDENTGQRPEEVLRRLLNTRIFLGDESKGGYDFVKVAQIVRTSAANPEPTLSPRFIPALLRVQGHEPLLGRLKEICDELRSTNDALARDISRRMVTWAMRKGADALLRLHTTNAHVATLEQACLAEGVHPYQAYLHLCHLAGSLAIFASERACPPIRLYEHEDLGECFHSVCDHVRRLLHAVWSTTWDSRPFEPDPAKVGHLHADLPKEWLEPKWSLYLGIDFSRSRDRTKEQVLKRARGNVKLAATHDMVRVLETVIPGIKLSSLESTPDSLPPLDDTCYLLLDEEQSSADRWSELRRTETITLCFADKPLDDLSFSLVAGLNERA